MVRHKYYTVHHFEMSNEFYWLLQCFCYEYPKTNTFFIAILCFIFQVYVC